jgi:glycerophosphoryl diester phosphodiesterase
LLVSTVRLIRKFGLQGSVTLLSFDHGAISLAKEIAPEIRAAINIPAARGAVLTSRAVLRSAEEAAADEVALHYGLATHRAVEALHRRGLRVSAWTVNRKVLMRRLIRFGVDSIITDFPDRLLAVIR